MNLKQAALDQNPDTAKSAQIKVDSAKQENLSLEAWIIGSQRLEIMQQLCQQMMLGINYIKHFSQQLDKYPKPYGEQMRLYLVMRLQKYKEYADVLNEEVEAKYKINVELIDAILIKLDPKIKKNTKEVD